MARRRSWKDMNTQQRTAALALVAVTAVLAAAAQRDLAMRPAAFVRGPKVFWRIMVLNTVGAVAYFVVGRRTAVRV